MTNPSTSSPSPEDKTQSQPQPQSQSQSLQNLNLCPQQLESLPNTTTTDIPTTTTTAANMSTTTAPRRLLFISSIGNQKPYRSTRHSAGHILLDALSPILPSVLPATTYTTWYSPSYMNESGPKLVRQLQRWFEKIDGPGGNGAASQWVSALGVALPLGGGVSGSAGTGTGTGTNTGVPATLVILHDELESPLGKVRVKRGGPEASSLRGHRGLISVFESLRGKKLYPGLSNGNGNGNGKAVQTQKKGKGGGLPRDLSVLRVGVGIGRPESRGKNAVADYVLTEMDEREMEAIRRAVAPVVGVLEEELSFEG